MIEVSFSSCERAAIVSFEQSAAQSASDWADKSFDLIKKVIKDHYLKVQNYTCCFCRQRTVVKHNRGWDTEHIISRSSNPKFMFYPQNLCVTCIDCNVEKSSKNVLVSTKKITKFPARSSAYLIVHPHFDNYDDHIRVVVAGQLYEWITPKGRETLHIYGLDRFLKIADRSKLPGSNLRRLLVSALLSKDNDTYDSAELELLEYLALKHSDKLGPQLSVDLLKSLRVKN